MKAKLIGWSIFIVVVLGIFHCQSVFTYRQTFIYEVELIDGTKFKYSRTTDEIFQHTYHHPLETWPGIYNGMKIKHNGRVYPSSSIKYVKLIDRGPDRRVTPFYMK